MIHNNSNSSTMITFSREIKRKHAYKFNLASHAKIGHTSGIELTTVRLLVVSPIVKLNQKLIRVIITSLDETYTLFPLICFEEDL